MTEKKAIVFYHDDNDGFAAAYAAWLELQDAAYYVPVQYDKYAWVSATATFTSFVAEEGQQHWYIDDLDVYFVDFSVSRKILTEMASFVNDVYVIDHHKTAQEELMQRVPGDEDHTTTTWVKHPHLPDNVTLIYDMHHAGNVLAWKYFHGKQQTPHGFELLEIYDLWKKDSLFWNEALAYQVAISSYPRDFMVWRDIFMWGTADIIDGGNAIQRYLDKQIAERVKNARIVSMRLAAKDLEATHTILVSNAPYFMASQLGNKLCTSHGVIPDYAFVYQIEPDDMVRVSLRSVGDFDVSAIAKEYGGGGHKNAAGMTWSLAELTHFLNYSEYVYDDPGEGE